MKMPGFGFLKFHLYTRPLDALDARAAAERLPLMRASLRRLRPFPAPAASDTAAAEIVFLTGDAFLYQTVFSAYSLLATTGGAFRFRVLSDRTLTPDNVALLRHVFPDRVACPDIADDEARIDALFPRTRFPALRAARDECALLRKLLDTHGGMRDWRLFLDSDTYFHRRPDALLACIADASRGCFMRDRWSNYGHAPEFLERLTGRSLLRHVNSGVVGLRSESIDWERVEHWFAAMVRAGGNFVFFEQGVTAMLLSQADPVMLPAEDYVVGPSRREVARPRAVFHHYTGTSKNRFIRFNTPRALFRPSAS